MKKRLSIFVITALVIIMLMPAALAADGEISFAFTGGSGRATITCEKIDTTDSGTIATIVFSSSNYTYAEVDGTQYMNTNTTGNSTFEIPINLNGITEISAETVAMGTPHVVDYSLYLYTDGTDAANAAGISTEDTAHSDEDTATDGTLAVSDSKGLSTTTIVVICLAAAAVIIAATVIIIKRKK